MSPRRDMPHVSIGRDLFTEFRAHSYVQNPHT